MNKKFLKICGITSVLEVKKALRYINPDALGVIFYKKSPRNISIQTLKEIFEYLSTLPSPPLLVGVTVNAKKKLLEKISPFLDIFQFHGDETPQEISFFKKQFPEKKIWKAITIQQQEDLKKISEYPRTDMILLDAFCEEERGGSGKKIPEKIFPLLKKISAEKSFLIAGGINSENFNSIIHETNAFGIDLSSSIEGNAKGIKDEEKVKKFGEVFTY